MNDIEIVILRYLQCGSFHWWGPLIRSLKERHRRNPLGSWKRSAKVLIVLYLFKVFCYFVPWQIAIKPPFARFCFTCSEHFKQIQVIGCWDGYSIHQEHRCKILPHHTACTSLKLCDLQTFVPCDSSSPSKNTRQKDLCYIICWQFAFPNQNKQTNKQTKSEWKATQKKLVKTRVWCIG